MKKRSLVAFLALTLFLCCFCTSLAETTHFSLIASDIGFSRFADVLYYRPADSNYYYLIDADGQRITSEPYVSINTSSSHPFFVVKVASDDGMHCSGLIDIEGKTLIPPQYDDIEVFSERWYAGINLTPSTADEKDYTFTNYSTNEKTFWRIDTVDFYYRGALAGTLTRSDYGDSSTVAHGDYICVKNRANENIYYNKYMQRSPVPAEYSSEFVSVRYNGTYANQHQGSGQMAFVPGCTLTADEVDKAYNYDHGIMYNLDGSIAFAPKQNYDSIRDYHGDYAIVSMNSKKGLIDKMGNEIIPLEYDDLGNYEDEYLKYGYISAVKDGKFGFVDASGRPTTPFTYASDIVNSRGTFASIKNLDGKYIVISAAVGEFPEHYAEVSFGSSYGSLAFVAQNDYKQYSLIDLYGNTIIPFGDEYRYIYVNAGHVAYASKGNRQYEVFHLDDAPASSSAAPAAPMVNSVNPADFQAAAANSSAASPAASSAGDGTWTCASGHAGNTGKFCTECGAPKPEAPKASFCTNCGHKFEGEVPKFCPDCGAKQHD